MTKYLHKLMALLLAVTLLSSNMGTVFAADESPVMDSTPQVPEITVDVPAAEVFSGGTPGVQFKVTQNELNTLLDAAGPTGITLDETVLAADPADAALIASGVRNAITESGNLLLEQRDLGNNCTALILARRDAGGSGIEHVAIIGVNGNADADRLVKAQITGGSLYFYDSEVSSWSVLPTTKAAMAAAPELRSNSGRDYDNLYPLAVPAMGYSILKLPTNVADSPFALMEHQLNPGGIADVPLAIMEITGPSEPIPTGDLIIYKVFTKTEPTPAFKYSDTHKSHLYMYYDDVKCYFSTPQDIKMYSDSRLVKVDEGKNLYCWTIGRISAEGGHIKSTNFAARVSENGITSSGNTFTITEAYLTAKVSVTDENTGETRIYDETNGMRFDAETLPTVENVAEENWLLTKKVDHKQTSGGRDYEISGDELTIKYDINLLLDKDSGFPSGDSDYYGRYGRLNFTEFELTEKLPVVGSLGAEVKPIRSRMTMTDFYGNNEVELAAGGLGDSELFVSGENGYNKKAYPKYELGEKAPYASYYHVTVVYSVSELKNAFYNMPVGTDSLLLDNTVTLKYKQPGAPLDDTGWVVKTANAECDFMAELAPITIEKLIRLGVSDLPGRYMDYAYDKLLAVDNGFTGRAAFQVTDVNGQPAKVYSKTDDQYTLLDEIEIDPINNPACNGSTTIYVRPGTYTVTETEAPDNTALNDTPQMVTAAVGTHPEVEVLNKMTYGELRFKKLGGCINNGLENQTWVLPNVEFTIEIPGWRPITVTSNSEGEVVQALPKGTATVTETAPTGYMSAGPWTVEIKDRELATIGENPDADGVAQIINQKNETMLEVEKRLWIGTGVTTIPEKDRAGFKFAIQRKTTADIWEDVPGVGLQSLTNSTDGRATFTVALPIYKDAAGSQTDDANKWVYRIEERIKPVEYNYLSQYVEFGVLEPNYVNTLTVENTRFISVSGTKTWDDNNNAAGSRPASITVNLLRNGSKADSRVITAASGWKYSFPNLPELDSEKKAYAYTLTSPHG